jgi:hypothetical protein
MSSVKTAKSKAPERNLSFVDGDRTFTCRVAPLRGSDGDLWWWFSVSSGNGSRYAPFQAEPDQTDQAVKERVVAYYDDHLARRAAPSAGQWRRGPAGAQR